MGKNYNFKKYSLKFWSVFFLTLEIDRKLVIKKFLDSVVLQTYSSIDLISKIKKLTEGFYFEKSIL